MKTQENPAKQFAQLMFDTPSRLATLAKTEVSVEEARTVARQELDSFGDSLSRILGVDAEFLTALIPPDEGVVELFGEEGLQSLEASYRDALAVREQVIDEVALLLTGGLAQAELANRIALDMFLEYMSQTAVGTGSIEFGLELSLLEEGPNAHKEAIECAADALALCAAEAQLQSFAFSTMSILPDGQEGAVAYFRGLADACRQRRGELTTWLEESTEESLPLAGFWESLVVPQNGAHKPYAWETSELLMALSDFALSRRS